MNNTSHQRFLHPRTVGLWPRYASVFIIATILAIGPRPAAAQMELDYNGDGAVTCADFEQQFPETFTDEATNALQQYPDDLSSLNDDPDEDAIACEGQPASPAPASVASPPTIEPPALTTGPAVSGDVPADVMARVEGCAVVAISFRDVVGAGCPGVGVVMFHIPDDAPSMQDTVIMHPGAAGSPEPAAPARDSSGTALNSADDANTGKARLGKSTTGSTTGESTKTGKTDTASSNPNSNTNTNSNSNKSTDDTKSMNGKNQKDKKGKRGKKGKKGEKGKDKNAKGKNGKHGKSKKQGKKQEN